MILKSFLIEKNISLLAKYNATLIYGENIGLKDDLKSEIKIFFKNTEYFNFNQDEIIRNPRAANNVSMFARFPSFKKVASLLIIRPPLFSPMKPINNPTPAPIAILRFNGMLSIIQPLNLLTLTKKNKTPAKKTDPRAISQE